MNNLPVELEFSVERLKRYLETNPHDAKRLAIAHFVDFSLLALEFKKLKMEHQQLEIENSKLKSAKTHRPVTLPAFLNSDRGAS